MGTVFIRQGRLAEAYKLLEESRLIASTPPTVWQSQLLLGLERDLAAAEQRWEEALAAAKAVCKRWVENEVRWSWAHALVEWAEVYVTRNEPADQERAKEIYNEAKIMFQEMGNTPYANYVQEQILRLERGSA